MTQTLRGGVFARLRPYSVDAGEPTWRRVPKVDMLPESRLGVWTPVLLALLAVIVVEAVVLRYLYSDFLVTGEETAFAVARLTDAERLRSQEESTVAGLDATIQELDAQIEQLSGALAQAGQRLSERESRRAEWAAPLQALLGADGPEVRLERVVAGPDRVMELTGTATGVAAMRTFQAHMLSVGDALDLRSLQWEEGDESLVFTAEVRVR